LSCNSRGALFCRYDFAVYGLLAPEIGHSFFPKSSSELQLINSFGVYLAAFLMRPLGAILFGEIGDRMVGRKNALMFSILLITVPSILMGLLPKYETWGVCAPIILVILRMMQGLSVGGQLAGSYVLSIEQSSSKTRGFRGSVCDASSVGGFLLASGVTTTTRSILTEEQVDDWGWRLPFLFSLILAPVLYFIVTNAEESKLWSERNEQKETEELIRENEKSDQPAVVDLFSSPFRRRQLTGMIGVLCATSSSFYMLFLWTPVYLSELRGLMKQKEADLLNFFVVGIYIFFVLISGWLSDKFPHRMDLIRIGLPGIIIGCPVMFGMFESETWIGYVLGQLQFGACLSLMQGSIAAWEVELWMADPTLSFTGVAIGHNVASTIFGGTMPLVATYLYYRAVEIEKSSEEDILWPRLLPGLYVSVLGLLSLYCVSFVVRHPHDVRIGGSQLRNAVQRENRKYKQATKQKKKKRKELEASLKSGDGLFKDQEYQPPTVA
jgi:MHS family proline/betaine transporter-like MFS transporter